MHRPSFVIGLLAQAGHGKSTAAKYLEKSYDAKIVSLAGPLKRAAKAVMKFSDEQLYGSQEAKERIDKRYGMSARTFLRLLGTEGLRDCFWPSIHLDKLQLEIESQADTTPFSRIHVVDDVRFLNEVEHLNLQKNTHGGMSAVIRLICTDSPPVESKHTSEQIDAIPSEIIAATITSSRQQGIKHLTSEIERVIDKEPRLAPFKRIFRESRQRLARAPRERLARAGSRR
jgi:hypothetical protein